MNIILWSDNARLLLIGVLLFPGRVMYNDRNSRTKYQVRAVSVSEQQNRISRKGN